MTIKVNKHELAKLADSVEKIIARVDESERKLVPFKLRAHGHIGHYWNPAELLVAAALVNQNRFESVVIPRVQRFRSEHKGVDSIAKLRKLINAMSDRDLYVLVLHFGTGKNPRNYRAPLLRGLVKAFDEYGRTLKHTGKTITDYEVLRRWARHPEPMQTLIEANGAKIPGLGEKLVDWLRMYGGDVPTVPADRYTQRAMEELGLKGTGETASFVARLFGLSPYALNLALRPKSAGS